jgi:hypothetical protein
MACLTHFFVSAGVEAVRVAFNDSSTGSRLANGKKHSHC